MRENINSIRYSGKAARRRALAVLLCVLTALLCLGPVSLAATASKLNITQIVQNDAEFVIYAGLLDSQNNAWIGSGGGADDFSVQIGATSPVHPESAVSFSQTGQGVAYIIAVDVSGSVTKNESAKIKESLKDFINEIGQNDYVKLITIGSEVRVICEYTRDRNALRDMIDSSIHRKDNKTNLFEGLYRAIEGINSRSVDMPRRDAIIVFTDGKDDSNGAWTEVNVLELMQRTQKAPVYAVAIKGNDKTVNPANLNRLCELTSGVFFTGDGDSFIPEAVSRIRSIVNSATVLSVYPEQDELFGVENLDFKVTMQSSGQQLISPVYSFTTIPRSAKPVSALAFSDPGIEGAVRAALGKGDEDELTRDDLPLIATITALNADGRSVKSLGDLWLMPDLETLSLKHNLLGEQTSSYYYGEEKLPGLEELQNLSRLKSLDLEDNKLEDITPLKYLTGLEYLNLHDNKIQEIDAVKDMTSLVSLDASRNKISDISPLIALNALQTANLSDNNIADPRPVASLKSLEYINLSQNEIQDASALSRMEWLDELDLSHNKIKDTLPLYNLSLGKTVIKLSGNVVEVVATPTPTPTPSPTPTPTPTPTPSPTPVPPTNMEKLAEWFSKYWIYAAIGFVILAAGITVLAVRSAKRDKKLVEGVDIEDDLDDYDPNRVRDEDENLDATLPSNDLGSFDPDATIPLGGNGVTRIRFVEEFAGRTREHTKPIGKELIIGRLNECSLVLDDKHVSRKHAKITLKYNGLYIQDLGSTSGTSVNGISVVGEKMIKQGDVIKMGDTTLKISILT